MGGQEEEDGRGKSDSQKVRRRTNIFWVENGRDMMVIDH